MGGQINSLELSFDVINIGNLLNKDWGHTYGDGFGRYFSPFNYEGDGLFKFDGTHVIAIMTVITAVGVVR